LRDHEAQQCAAEAVVIQTGGFGVLDGGSKMALRDF